MLIWSHCKATEKIVPFEVLTTSSRMFQHSGSPRVGNGAWSSWFGNLEHLQMSWRVTHRRDLGTHFFLEASHLSILFFLLQYKFRMFHCELCSSLMFVVRFGFRMTPLLKTLLFAMMDAKTKAAVMESYRPLLMTTLCKRHCCEKMCSFSFFFVEMMNRYLGYSLKDGHSSGC